jgi:hypothetical protein
MKIIGSEIELRKISQKEDRHSIDVASHEAYLSAGALLKLNAIAMNAANRAQRNALLRYVSSHALNSACSAVFSRLLGELYQHCCHTPIRLLHKRAAERALSEVVTCAQFVLFSRCGEVDPPVCLQLMMAVYVQLVAGRCSPQVTGERFQGVNTFGDAIAFMTVLVFFVNRGVFPPTNTDTEEELPLDAFRNGQTLAPPAFHALAKAAISKVEAQFGFQNRSATERSRLLQRRERAKEVLAEYCACQLMVCVTDFLLCVEMEIDIFSRKNLCESGDYSRASTMLALVVFLETHSVDLQYLSEFAVLVQAVSAATFTTRRRQDIPLFQCSQSVQPDLQLQDEVEIEEENNQERAPLTPVDDRSSVEAEDVLLAETFESAIHTSAVACAAVAHMFFLCRRRMLFPLYAPLAARC